MQHSKRTLTNLSYHRERRGRGEARNQETLQNAAGIPRIAMSGTSAVRPEHSGSKPSQANHEPRITQTMSLSVLRGLRGLSVRA